MGECTCRTLVETKTALSANASHDCREAFPSEEWFRSAIPFGVWRVRHRSHRTAAKFAYHLHPNYPGNRGTSRLFCICQEAGIPHGYLVAKVRNKPVGRLSDPSVECKNPGRRDCAGVPKALREELHR